MAKFLLPNLNQTIRQTFGRISRPISEPPRKLHYWVLWLNKVFNAVDRERLKLVGPDLVCAEWLLRNGAQVRFKGHLNLLSDYNELMEIEKLDSKSIRLEEVYAKNCTLNHIGFDHFKGCLYVRRITLILCRYVDADCLDKLYEINNSLEHLEIKSCYNVNDKGLLSLTRLKNLHTLILDDLPAVNNKKECETSLRNALSRCRITYSY